jgi:hypothetical protein
LDDGYPSRANDILIAFAGVIDRLKSFDSYNDEPTVQIRHPVIAPAIYLFSSHFFNPQGTNTIISIQANSPRVESHCIQINGYQRNI